MIGATGQLQPPLMIGKYRGLSLGKPLQEETKAGKCGMHRCPIWWSRTALTFFYRSYLFSLHTVYMDGESRAIMPAKTNLIGVVIAMISHGNFQASMY